MTAEDIEKRLQDRLDELHDEERRIRRALEHLSTRDRPRRTSPRSATAPRASSQSRRTGKRAAPGERQRQLLNAITQMSGASASELADALGVVSPQVYGMLRSLEAKGRVEKKGQGFVVIGETD